MPKVSSTRDLPRVRVAASEDTLAQSAKGPESQQVDQLQTLADQSLGVRETEKAASMANAQATAGGDQTSDADPGSTWMGALGAKLGPGSKMVSAGTGVLAAGTTDEALKKMDHPGDHDQWGITNDVLVGVQHSTQLIYSLQDCIEKKDPKSGLAVIADITNGLLALEKKLHVVGVSEDLFPVLGGAISGLRQLLNAKRVSESLDTLNTIGNKPVFSEDDKKIINAFKKEQQVSLIKHGLQSLIAFASMASPLLGPAGPVVFPILQAIIPTIATIRDQWINYVESSANKAKAKAQKRLGVESDKGDATGDLSFLQDVMVQESKNNALLAADLVTEDELTADKFSIRKLMETYNVLQSSKADLKTKDPNDDDYGIAEACVEDMESGLKAAIDEYNVVMGRMTSEYFKNAFTPITLDTVQKLHDYHIHCIHTIMVQAKEREQKLQETASLLKLFMKTEEKQAILAELYGGKVPEKVDINLAEMTAETQDYFWVKTQKEIGNAVREVQMSKATLVDKMNKIMKKNKAAILKNMQGEGNLFQNEAKFDSDVKVVVNTLNL